MADHEQRMNLNLVNVSQFLQMIGRGAAAQYAAHTDIVLASNIVAK